MPTYKQAVEAFPILIHTYRIYLPKSRMRVSVKIAQKAISHYGNTTFRKQLLYKISPIEKKVVPLHRKNYILK